MVLPEDFLTQMKEQLGAQEYIQFCQALTETEAPTSIRLNPKKRILPPTDSEPIPWCPDGYYLPHRPAFTLDPLFHAGCYYVQEASSMYLATILKNIKTQELNISHVLDLCAAPGGKSTLLLSQLTENTLVVCNEVVRSRAQILRENIIKWGYPNAVVTSNEVRDFQRTGVLFDLILCDAPCSGEGMFRKDPQSINEWSLRNVDMCQKRQRDIVSDIWPCLRPNGILIYSTCTYNKKENEHNVQWICQQLGAELLESHRFMPHKTKGEGLFLAVLKKTSDVVTNPVRFKKSKQKITKPHQLSQWLETTEPFNIVQEDNEIYAYPQTFAQSIDLIRHHLHVLHFGIQIATIKGKVRFQPSHSLAMSNLLNINAFPKSDIDSLNALSYLRTEAITLPKDTPRGYVLLTYQNHPFGFVNNIGTRANNLYPYEWRIRKQ